MKTNPRVYGRGTFYWLKKANQEAFYAQKTKDKNFVRSEFKRELVLF